MKMVCFSCFTGKSKMYMKNDGVPSISQFR